MKNRDNIYLVVRVDAHARLRDHVCGAYKSETEADLAASAFMQKWIDRGWDDGSVKFEVHVTTFYDQ